MKILKTTDDQFERKPLLVYVTFKFSAEAILRSRVLMEINCSFHGYYQNGLNFSSDALQSVAFAISLTIGFRTMERGK